MSEPAYTRSSEPSLTAQVVLRRRAEGNHKRLSRVGPAGNPDETPALAHGTVPSLPLAAVDEIDVLARWCCYCGHRVRTALPACRFHSDLLVLDVGEARD